MPLPLFPIAPISPAPAVPFPYVPKSSAVLPPGSLQPLLPPEAHGAAVTARSLFAPQRTNKKFAPTHFAVFRQIEVTINHSTVILPAPQGVPKKGSDHVMLGLRTAVRAEPIIVIL